MVWVIQLHVLKHVGNPALKTNSQTFENMLSIESLSSCAVVSRNIYVGRYDTYSKLGTWTLLSVLVDS
jgi:hypothetical protein